MSYRGVGKTRFSTMFPLLGNEKSNTGQSDRSNRMIWGFQLNESQRSDAYEIQKIE